MSLEDELRRVVGDAVREAVSEALDRPDVADLTVADIARAHDKAESTVRGWMPDVPGAYRLGNEWRVSRKDWRAYLDGLAEEEKPGRPEVRSKPSAELGDWREGE